MTLSEINTMIANFGLPYAYHHFTEKTAQEPPFIVFFYPSINDLYADGINYQRISELDVELYTSNKDFAKEEMIESALTNAGFSFYKEENYIASEKIWQIAYEMDVVITEPVTT